jgi:hypothetical protein
VNINNYTNSDGVSEIVNFDGTKISIDQGSLQKNLIGVAVKISRSPNYIFLVESQKSGLYLIIFQIGSIVISIFGLSKIILNFLTIKRILKFLMCFWCRRKKKISGNDLELGVRV